MMLEKSLQKDLRDREKMSMEETLEKNRDREVDLEVVIRPNAPDRTPSFDLEADPGLDYKDLGLEIVGLTRNPYLDEDPFLADDVNRQKGDQLPEEDPHRGNDHFPEGGQDLYLENEGLCQEEDPGDQSRGREDLCRDLDKEDLYQDPEDLYLDLATDARTRKSINLVADRETGRSLAQSHLESLQSPERGSIRREKLKADRGQRGDLVREIGSKLKKL
ncbi:unnamed protein product [Xylocopa violacea]|uniref:Uncharacterized protein n=1 Tax=Xylocopa violacea TaxID=135666 RepID=A0ABP1PCD7_XYLVO